MAKSLEEVTMIKDELSEKYMGKGNVIGIGISKVGIIEPNASKERLDNFCITVYVDKELDNQDLREYKGIKVYQIKSGQINAL